MIEIEDINDYTYLLPFEVEADFGLDVINNEDELLLSVNSNYELDTDLLKAQLDDLL